MQVLILKRGAGAALAVLALLSAACSANGGFGSPSPPVPPGGQMGQPAYGASPTPFALSSGSPGPTSSPTSVYLSSAVVRAAYDGSAKDPVKANRLLEVTFGFKNPTADPDILATLNVAPDGDKIGVQTNVTLQIPPAKSSDVAVVAVGVKQDLTKIKHISLTFANVDGDDIATTMLDAPALDLVFTPLDDKKPAGALSIVGLDVTRVTGPGSGLHYECTFGLMNASGSKVAVDSFTIAPPKGTVAQMAIPVSLAERTSSSLMTFVLPSDGKSLPAGKYTVTAISGGSGIAQATADLL
jgi:hypothetical protein